MTLGALKNIRLEWLVIAGLLIYILLLQECSPTVPNRGGSAKIGKYDTLKFTSDTNKFTYIDTVQFIDTVPHYVKVPVPIPVPYYDTIQVGDSTVIRALNRYTTIIEDSLLKGELVAEVDGVLVSQDFKYFPKFPKYIYQTDCVIVDNTAIIEKKKMYLMIGAEFGGSTTQFNFSPVVDVRTRKGNMYGYRYGVIDKTHNVRFSKTIRFKLPR